MNCSSRARSSGTSSWSPDPIYGRADDRMPRESGQMIFVPRPHQLAARDAILAARREGRPGFLLGDLTGLGKTLSVWAALAAMAEDDILVVCPKDGMPQWRRTMALSGLSPKKVTLINYESTKSLFTPPPASTRRSARAKNNELARHGQPKRTWPVVVFDESHRLRNPYAQQSMACRQLADRASFAIYMSATAGQSPHELSYLGRLLGRAARYPTETLADYRLLMKTLGIGRAKGRWTNWSWQPNERDRNVMSDLLYKGEDAPSDFGDGRATLRDGQRFSGSSQPRPSRRTSVVCTMRPGASSGASLGWQAAQPGAWPAGRPICGFGKRRACSALLAQQPSPTTSSLPASRSQYPWHISRRVLSWRRRYAHADGASARSMGSERRSSTKLPGLPSRPETAMRSCSR